MKNISHIVTVTLFSILSASLFPLVGYTDQCKLPGDYSRVTTMESLKQYHDFLLLLQKSMDQDSKPWLEKLVRPGSRILEIGPGLGSMTHYMATRAGGSGHIDVLDNNPAFLKDIEAMAPNITTINGDIRDYPLEPEKYDVIYARGVMELLVQSDHQAIFQKLANALKPCGRLLIESLVDENPESRLIQLKTRDKVAYDALIKIYRQSKKYGYMDLAIGHKYQEFVETAGLKVDKAEKIQRLVRGGAPEREALKLALSQLRDVIINGTCIEGIEGVDECALNRVHLALADPDFSFFTPSRLFILSHK